MTHSRKSLSPAVAADAAEAWQIADEQARQWASLRDRLGEVWGEVEDMSRIKVLLRVQKPIAGLKKDIDEAARRSQMTQSEKNKLHRDRKAMAAVA
jgi:hypothetical protein